MRPFLQLVIGYPRSVLAILTVVSIYMIFGLLKLDIHNNYDADLPMNDPILITNNILNSVFGDERMIVLGIENDTIINADRQEGFLVRHSKRQGFRFHLGRVGSW
jgi:predicted RND superfamily exporter protein